SMRPSIRHLALLSLLWLLARPRPALADRWPADVASYQVRVELLAGHQLRGEEVIRYRNPSPDALSELYFHLYLNAFRAPDTPWQRESGEQIDPAYPGWIKVEQLVAEDGADLLASGSEDDSGTVLRVPLPRPLAAGDELTLRADWTAQLPRA